MNVGVETFSGLTAASVHNTIDASTAHLGNEYIETFTITVYINSPISHFEEQRTQVWVVRGTMNLESEGVVVSEHNFDSPALLHLSPR